MPTVTQRKNDLKEILYQFAMRHYLGRDEKGRIKLVRDLIKRLLATMTLAKLRSWHLGMLAAETLRESEEAKRRELE